jgi:hypothetical protein
LQQALPEYDQYQLAYDWAMIVPQGKPTLHVFGDRVEFVCKPELSGKQAVLLVVPPDRKLEVFDDFVPTSGFQPVPRSGGMLYEINVSDIHTFR